MQPEPNQAERAGVGLLVDQHEIGFHVAIAVVPPLAAQPMIVMPGLQRTVVGQGLHETHQAGNEGRPVPAPGLRR